jgi:protein-disulfide isomerase
MAEAVRADERLARSLGVESTPTLFVNGQRINNPLNFAEIQQAIETVSIP